MQPVSLETPASPHVDHLGIIAGEGDFPLLIARAARERQVQVSAIGITGITNPRLAGLVDHMFWVEFGKFNRLIQLCHEAGFQKAVMVGRIKHNSIFQLSKIDWRGIKMLAKAPTRRADDLLNAVTAELSQEKIELLDSTLFLRECMPPAGLLTPGCPPGDRVLDDIDFGRPLAKSIAGLDVGQTIVVKDRSVVAVEAMEGTDLAILRAGTVAGPGCVVIKVCKPNQDRRFDVPIIGLTTIRKLVEAQARAIAFPGGDTLFFDQEAACELAATHGISILAW